MRARRLALLAIVTLAASRSAPAQLQYFGQNKIQYHDFDWHMLKGDHVDVYYYPAEEEIGRMALAYAEQSYDTLERRLGHHVTRRIPLIIYASHYDFQQTNVLPFVPPEGILGVTEYLKRRVTIPFRGSYSEFRHTLRHELVHVFQLSIETQQFALYPRGHQPNVPLWWSEGLAEYLSSPQDSRDQMIVRDLALSSRMPTIGQLNLTFSPIVYPLGGELHHFLAERYGEWRIGLLYQTLWKYGTFDDAMRGVYGRSVERLSDEWLEALRQRFYPTVIERQPIGLAGVKIAPLALKPLVVPRADSGSDVVYLSPFSGYTNIYRKPLDERARPRVVVAGERSPEFESLHEFSSRLDSRNGILVFGSKFGDRDALFFYDMGRDRVIGRYQFDGIVSVLSPAWSPDGGRIAFSGLAESGVSDIYVFEMASHQLTHVTTDRFEDLDPSWLPGGRSIVFSSDRASGGADGALNLYRAELGTGAIAPITAGNWRDESPRWDPQRQRVYFTSDRDGTFALYSSDTLGNGSRETSIEGGVFDPAPVPNDSRVVVTGFSKLDWSLYVLQPDSVARRRTFARAAFDSTRWTWSELADARATQARALRYHRRYTLDFAAGQATSVPSIGGVQGADLYFSDLLGDHIISASLASYQLGASSDFLSNLNGSVFYLNQQRRINWGIGAFRVAGTFVESDLVELYNETSYGVFGAIRYPLSRFTRIEGNVSLEHSDRFDFANVLVQGPLHRVGVLSGNFVSLVGDNTLWLSTGPIDGMRYNLTGGVVSDITHGAFENWYSQLDVRRYYRTSLHAAIALRGYAYVSEGIRPRVTQIAGSWALRGYPRYEVTGTHAWLFNSEYRFPLANYVTFGFPFGAISFPQLQGAVFADLAQAWNAGAYDHRALGSAGVGLRMPLIPGFVLRFDAGRRFSFRGNDSNPDVREYYSKRFVDFFIGYDY